MRQSGLVVLFHLPYIKLVATMIRASQNQAFLIGVPFPEDLATSGPLFSDMLCNSPRNLASEHFAGIFRELF